MIVTQWFTQCGDQEVCTEPAPPPEVPGMSWREAGKSVSSESGVCSAAVSAMLRSLPSLGLACGCKSVQQGLRTVSHQSPSPMPCLPGGLPQASIPPPPPLAVHTRAQGAEGPRPPACPSPRGQSVSLGNPLIYSLLQNLFLCKRLFLHLPWRRRCNPLRYYCLEIPRTEEPALHLL